MLFSRLCKWSHDKKQKRKRIEKKKERQSSCTPHIHAKAHYVPLAKPNPTAVSPLLQDAAHHFAYTFMCNSVPCLTWKKKKRLETLATSRQIKEKRLPSFAQQKKRGKNYQNNNKSNLKKKKKRSSPMWTYQSTQRLAEATFRLWKRTEGNKREEKKKVTEDVGL